ncbi:PAC2 family protein [Candidatus Micrarchaeota archaeon]|nr:PAC2 family protein [Candidatus Micrarchaeota archaeon]
MFTSSKIMRKKSAKLKQPVLIAGLPGIGLVSKLTVDNLVAQLKARKIAALHSPFFPNQVLAMKGGKLKPFTMKIYAAKAARQDVVLLTGDIQPLTVEGQYEVCNKVLSYFNSLGGRKVVGMAGYSTASVGKTPKVYCAATSKEFFKQLKGFGAQKLSVHVPIVGMAGMLPALAKNYGMEGACLLAETPGTTIDSSAATALTALLEKMLGAKINSSNIAKKASKTNELIQKIEAQAAQQQMPQIDPAKKANLSYIH